MKYKGYKVYEEADFFKKYTEKRAKGNAPNETIEKPIIEELIGVVKDKNILDLGCGDGQYGKELLIRGASSYDGVEGSKNMIKQAKKVLEGYRSTIEEIAIEDYAFPTEKYDLVLSRLVFHYIAHLEKVFVGIHTSLKTGGELIFSVEHPIITSCYDSYQEKTKRGNWIVDNYFKSGERVNKWIGKEVIKYHRTLEEYFELFKANNFELISLKEAKPKAQNFDHKEEYERRSRIPLFIIFRLKKH